MLRDHHRGISQAAEEVTLHKAEPRTWGQGGLSALTQGISDEQVGAGMKGAMGEGQMKVI